MDIDSMNKANNKIEFVTIEYHQTKKINNGNIIERKECICLDKKEQKLFIKQDYANCVTSKEYYIPNEIDSLLCQFEKASLCEEKSKEEKFPKYTMNIRYKDGKKVVLQAGFNRAELPVFWEEFAYELLEIIKNHGVFGDLLDFDIYGKGARKNEHIFCSVIFDNIIQPYYYLTEDNSLEIGDSVLVLFGKEKRIARISNIEYFDSENLPIDLDSIKKIIAKVDRKLSFPTT
ncbi:MAG: hypothetical protein R3Y33_06420 [Clostridia bacterium]